MSKVLLDNEEVQFSGPPPETVREVIALVEGHLADSGRSIAGLEVDGVSFELEAIGEESGFQLLAIRTVSLEHQLLAHCEQLRGNCVERSDEARSLSSQVLRSSWSECQSGTVQMLEGLRPLLEGAELVVRFGAEAKRDWSGSLAEPFEAAMDEIGRIADAVECGDCVGLSDALGELGGVHLSRFGEVLGCEVISELGGGASK